MPDRPVAQDITANPTTRNTPERSEFLGGRRSNATSAKAIAVLLKPLIDLHGEPRNWATAAGLYLDALADIPAELLAVAVKHAITSNPFFPKPADLRLSIVDELSDYRRRQNEARRALLPPPPDVPPPTPQEIAEVDALVANALRGMAVRSAELQSAPDLAGASE